MKFSFNGAHILEDIRKIGVGLVLAGLAATLFQGISPWLGLLSVILGTVFVLVGAIERTKEE